MGPQLYRTALLIDGFYVELFFSPLQVSVEVLNSFLDQRTGYHNKQQPRK